jgi:4-azaleucine resistance transporter AzlC
MTPQSQFWRGVRAILPIAIGIMPFGLAVGVVAIESGLPPDVAFSMSFIIFAGASQLVASQLYGAATPALLIILTASVVNLRMLMYSAALAPHFSRLSLRWKALLAYLLTDQAFALSIARFDEHPDEPHKHWYYLGSAVSMFVPWQIASAVGVFIGARVPPQWSLDFAAPLSFIAIWIPGLKDRPLVVAAIVGGLGAVLLSFLPYRLGVLFGALAGITAGYVVEARRA